MLRCLKKLKIDLPYDQVISLLRIYLKEFESVYFKSTCTPMFIAALLIKPKLRKQPRCPTTDERIKKIQYLYTMEFHSKKNEILFFKGRWMELENIILSEVSQSQKAKSHMFSLICRL
jgi:predicted membrane chloride channel (bestrophin family)